MENNTGNWSNQMLVQIWLEHYTKRFPVKKIAGNPLSLSLALGYLLAIKDIAYKYQPEIIDALEKDLRNLIEASRVN